MVTEIIKNEDINSSYMNPIRWLRDGISTYAVLVLIDESSAINGTYAYVNNIRNKIDYDRIDTIYPLNRW